VTYGGGEGHVAVLRRVRAPGAAIGLPVVDRHEWTLGRDPGGDYGHHVIFEATGADVAGATVEWAADGVSLSYRSGHRLFVPAAAFTGGR
jgi:hypothetical protein